jgi:hypothetical protein
MKKHYMIPFLFLILLSGKLFAQQKRCGFDGIHQKLMQQNAAYRQEVNAFDKQWSELQEIINSAEARIVVEGADTIYEIPTVIHVIHTGDAVGTIYNRSTADLTGWINYLNAVYAGTWAPYPSPATGGVKIPVRFALAQRDPSCNATTGIIRVDGSGVANYAANGMSYGGGPGATEAAVRALSSWPKDRYYNMYVINKINGEDGYNPVSSYIAGYAYLGVNTPSANDGAYMLSSVAESGESTLPHEIGHALGLYHTFQGATGPGSSVCAATETNCAAEGDLVCDTEQGISLLSTFPCPVTGVDNNPCTGVPYNNVQHNIMNYGACLNRFTPGQRNRMVSLLKTYRMGLVNSLGGVAPAAAPSAPVAANCTPVINPANASNNFSMGPCNVTLDSIQYASGGYNDDGNNAYITHMGDCLQPVTTSLIAGNSYSLSVSTVLNAQRVRAYIDYNNDGVFGETAPELILNSYSATVPFTHTVSFIPAATTVNTPLRMRIMSDFGSGTFTSCATLEYGQAEDFRIVVLPNIPTPIEISDIRLLPASCAATLQWTANNALNFARFDVERSTDGITFTALGSLKYNKLSSSYIYPDKLNKGGHYYYRIKMVDIDGKYSYSPVVNAVITCTGAAKVSVYPNPATSNVSVESTSAIDRILVMSTSGEILKQYKVAAARTSVDIGQLAPGFYLFRVVLQDGSTDNIKVIKN